MSYAAQKNEPSSSSRREMASHKVEPSVLKAAKQIYRDYLDTHASHLTRPLGAAVNRSDLSGKLVYKDAILLPQESFVPIEMLESAEHH